MSDSTQNNGLQLYYDDASSSWSTDINQSIKEIEWTVGQSGYLVTITLSNNNQYGNVALIITNSKNEPIETVLMERVEKDNNYTFKAISTVARFLKSGSKIYIGIVAGQLEFDADGNLTGTSSIKSSLLPVTLINSINTNLDPEVLSKNSTIVDELIEKFSSAEAKAIKELETTKYTVDGETIYHLRVKYLGETDFVDIGPVSVDLIGLGAEIKRDTDNSKGGGGKLGNNAILDGSKSGFAGGYNSKAYTGAAVGENAFAVNGFAGGRNARTQKLEGIAIGTDSLCEGVNSIALGSRAETSPNSNASVVIGRLSKAEVAKNSVVIGCSSWKQEDEQGNVDTSISDLEKVEDSFTIIKRTKAKETNNGVIIGPNAYTLKANAPIAIGLNATVRGQDGHYSYNGIAIGNNAITRYRSSISIGVDAKAGTTSTGGEVSGNETEEDESNGLGHVGAIAIGRKAFAKRHGTIALGKSAKAIQYGNISIGQGSLAGVEKDKDTTPSGDVTGNFRAVAIGYHATASAEHSVQLGQGTNNTANSLQFRDVTIVKDGAVQVDLGKKGVQGILPISKGGTGASSKKDIIKNLGIFTGKANFSVTKTELEKQGLGKDVLVKFEKSFSAPPHVVASLELAADYDPANHHIFIHKITKDGFTIRYKYTGSSKEEKKINVDYFSVG